MIVVRACVSMVAPPVGSAMNVAGVTHMGSRTHLSGFALRDSLHRLNENRPLTRAELAELSRPLVRFVAATDALLDYVEPVAGRPCRN